MASGAVLAAAAALSTTFAFADAPVVGMPTDGALGFQPAYSQMKRDVIWFHDWILLPIITAIVIFVAILLLICIVRYNRKANPTPAQWSHNTVIEVIWTAAPVLILMVVAVFSFKLLFKYHDMPRPDLTVKATGYQWYWGYAYPDQKIEEITSSEMPAEEARAKGVPFHLAASNPMVVPVNKVVRVLVTGADVIHAFSMPSFGNKIDAIPGRINQTWFKAEKIGVFYGQCSELCGIEHSGMPIQINVVSQADFDRWAASHAQPAAPATAAAPAPSAAPAAAAAIKTSVKTPSAAPGLKLAALN